MKYKGLGTALLTPFMENGTTVDYETWVKLLDRQVNNGVDFLVPLGTTGETPCLSQEERTELLRLTKEHVNCPIVVGGGTNSLTQTAENIRVMSALEPDAFLIVVPYYNKPTQEGMYQYFKAVAASTDKDIILYNVPGRTGVNMEAETTLRLAEIPNIVAIKEASGKTEQIAQILRNRPDDFAVLSGDDDATFSLMNLGADGVISVASNIVPQMLAQMVHAIQKGDILGARQWHFRLMPLFKACFVESNPISAKAAMAQLGLMENSLRLPLITASAKTEELWKQILDDLLQ